MPRATSGILHNAYFPTRIHSGIGEMTPPPLSSQPTPRQGKRRIFNLQGYGCVFTFILCEKNILLKKHIHGTFAKHTFDVYKV